MGLGFLDPFDIGSKTLGLITDAAGAIVDIGTDIFSAGVDLATLGSDVYIEWMKKSFEAPGNIYESWDVDEFMKRQYERIKEDMIGNAPGMPMNTLFNPITQTEMLIEDY
ncbi:hypothetical protein IIB79_10775, partial [candidate division KSB1 bacterium]|nr:hypothetical protein [candidate division KSB1 bacterium]